MNIVRNFFRSKIVLGIVVVLIVSVGSFFIFFNKGPTYKFITVERGAIVESVSLTGNTIPAQTVSLSFGSSGTISSVYTDLGKQVSKGQVLAELNTNDLVAQLHQAQANVEIQQAKLKGLESGTRPEDVAASQAALDKAKQDLTNIYNGINDTSTDSYAKANDAVRTQLNQFFTNGDNDNPKLTYLTTADGDIQHKAETARLSTTAALNKWQDQLTSVGDSSTDLEALLQVEVTYLATVRELINNLSKTLESAPSLSATTLATYKANVSTSLNEVNTATKNLNTISQNIASQKLTISQLQAQLDLKQAGSLPTDIAAQEAQVAQAQASVGSVLAKLENSKIVAPLSGTITQFDAKIGQTASAGVPLVSMMSGEGYEVDAGVSEIDVGKIIVGNKVSMTLDAFPSETFSGTVFYIAPAETNTAGVVNYKTKISFDKTDLRLKSGLTTNIDIQTKYKDGVLILPQYAVLQNDQGTFVETLENKVIKQNSVTLGIQDQKGNVEIVSGVTEGEQVLNIGLKV